MIEKTEVNITITMNVLPEVELAEPVLALSRDEEELVADDTPEEEKVCG